MVSETFARRNIMGYEGGVKILSESNIPFMHWGIINKYNFSEDKISFIPRKVFDKILYNSGSGHFSYISPVRGFRPKAYSLKGRVSKDVFKQIISGEDYAIFIAVDENIFNNVFSVKPMLLNIEDKKIATIINRFPSMVRVIDEDILDRVRHVKDIAWGVNLVSFPVKYFENLSEIDVDTLTYLIYSMNISIKRVLESTSKRGFNNYIIYPFFNIGYLAGGSQPRIHSQVYVDLTGYGLGLRFRGLIEVFRNKCPLCNVDGREVVYEYDDWFVWVNSAPRRNYEIRIVYREHLDSFMKLKLNSIRSLSKILINISKILDRLGVYDNRNILFYTKPLIESIESFHIFIEILPFEVIGGVELLDSCRVIRVNPRILVEDIRNLFNSL